MDDVRKKNGFRNVRDDLYLDHFNSSESESNEDEGLGSEINSSESIHFCHTEENAAHSERLNVTSGLKLEDEYFSKVEWNWWSFLKPKVSFFSSLAKKILQQS